MSSQLSDLMRAFRQQPEPGLPPSILTLAADALQSGGAIAEDALRTLLNVASTPPFLRALSHEQRYDAFEPVMRAAVQRL